MANAQVPTQYIDALSTTVGIISLVVGVTSLVMAAFSVWLSWQFYRESRGQNDQVQSAVTGIHTVVVEVQGKINQIVQQAVDAWIRASGVPEEEGRLAKDLSTSFDELRIKVDQLEKGKDDNARKELAQLISENQARTESLLTSFRELRVRSLFPSPAPTQPPAQELESRGPAVLVQQTVLNIGPDSEEGEISLDVLRPAKLITGTARLARAVAGAASVALEVLGQPEQGPGFTVKWGFGEGTQFNVHLHAENGERLALGTYRIKYKVDTA